MMLIIALIAGILAPALIRFTEGRMVDNFGRQIIGLCQEARSRSTSEAQFYYVTFDDQQITLTTVAPGQQQQSQNNQPPPAPVVQIQVPQGLRVSASLSSDATGQPQPRLIELLPWDPTFQPQPQPVQRNVQLLDGTPGGNETLWAFSPDTHFIQFSPTGLTDPMTILVSDFNGHSVQIACDSPSESFHEAEGAR